MKIIACGEKETVVSIPTQVLGRMLGIIIVNQRSNYSYGGALEYREMGGREYKLSPMLDALEQMRLAHECRHKIIEQLIDLQMKIDKSMWPIAEVKSIEPELKK